MKKCIFRLTSFLLLLALAPALSSCERALPSAKAVMTTFCESTPALPAGYAYYLLSEEYEENCLHADLTEAMFGSTLSFLADGALYLGASTASPTEMGIFVCRTGDDAERMASLCLARLSRLRRTFPAAETLSGSEVRRFGNTVVYTALPGNSAAMRLLGRLLE